LKPPPDQFRRGRIVLENTGQVVWEGWARDAEAEAVRRNTTAQGNQSYRPEQLDDDGVWQSIGFGRRRFGTSS
jgi:hypothetical protein